MLTLLVKGDRYVTARAAAVRAIPFVFTCETRCHETVGHTSDAFHDRVLAWFNEEGPGDSVPGTLLLFSLRGALTLRRSWLNAVPVEAIPGADDARVPPAPEIAPEIAPKWSELNRRANNILYGSRTT